MAEQAKKDELNRLKAEVLKYSDTKALPDRVRVAFQKAKSEQTFSRLQALQREIERMLDEEEVALVMVLATL